MARPISTPSLCLVDAHVHLHPQFDVVSFLDHAARNFATASPGPGLFQAGVLLLAETPGEGAFSRIAAAGSMDPRWSVDRTREPESIVATPDGGTPIVIVAGRQLVTEEGVEVLALLTAREFRHGLPLTDTLRLVRQDGAIAVLPWGFGQWSFGRGELVADALRSESGVFVGDNGGRWRRSPAPPLFALARQRSIPILPGSDPLPFTEQGSRAGSFGFVMPQSIDLAHPSRDLRTWLRAQRIQPAAYGQLESAGRFAWNQVRMQWRKRISSR